MDLDQPAITVDDWSAVYARTAADLVRFATVLVGPASADDVVADAVIRVLRSAPGRPVASPTAYLYRSIANTAHNHRRSASRRVSYEGRDGPARPVEQPEIRPEVAAAVAGLSAQQRAVIFLAYWLDLTPPLIAEHLDVSEGTVRRQLARARHKLRGVLDA